MEKEEELKRRNEQLDAFTGALKDRIVKTPFCSEGMLISLILVNPNFRLDTVDLVYKPPKYESKEKDVISWSPMLSTYMHAKRIEKKTTFLEKLRRMPYILKVAGTRGWKPGELAGYFFCVYTLTSPQLHGMSMLDVSA